MKKTLFAAFSLLFASFIFAQNDTIQPLKKADTSASLKFSGYIEAYFGYDFGAPKDHQRPSFLYNHKRHNEASINLAFAKVSYNSVKIRGNLALMVGNYAQYNLANEPNLLANILESNIGVKLSKKDDIWLDVGVFPSHIGFESPIGAESWTASRSLCAENSPYYESGIKATYTNKKQTFFASLMYLNGWQRINKPTDINSPSFGLQLNYKLRENMTLNYSNFVGTDKPDIDKVLRIYHNLYTIYEPTQKLGFTAGIDIGTETTTYSSSYSETNAWFSPVFIARYRVSKKSKIAARVEYFDDKTQVLIATYTPNGFQTLGYSLNYDYFITENAVFRAEIKEYSSKDAIFLNRTQSISQKYQDNTAFLATLSMKF